MIARIVDLDGLVNVDFEQKYSPIFGDYIEPVWEPIEPEYDEEVKAVKMKGELPDGSEYRIIGSFDGRYFVSVDWPDSEQITFSGKLNDCKAHVLYDLMEV